MTLVGTGADDHRGAGGEGDGVGESGSDDQRELVTGGADDDNESDDRQPGEADPEGDPLTGELGG